MSVYQVIDRDTRSITEHTSYADAWRDAIETMQAKSIRRKSIRLAVTSSEDGLQTDFVIYLTMSAVQAQVLLSEIVDVVRPAIKRWPE